MIIKKEVIRIATQSLAECCESLQLGPKKFSGGAKQWIRQRRWADDLQIKRAVYFAALVSTSEEVDRGHFPLRFPKDHEAFVGAQFKDIGLSEIVRQKFAHFLERVGDHDIEGIHVHVVRQIERAIIELAWTRSSGCQSKMARMLGLHRNTVRKKIGEMGIK